MRDGQARGEGGEQSKISIRTGTKAEVDPKDHVANDPFRSVELDNFIKNNREILCNGLATFFALVKANSPEGRWKKAGLSMGVHQLDAARGDSPGLELGVPITSEKPPKVPVTFFILFSDVGENRWFHEIGFHDFARASRGTVEVFRNFDGDTTIEHELLGTFDSIQRWPQAGVVDLGSKHEKGGRGRGIYI